MKDEYDWQFNEETFKLELFKDGRSESSYSLDLMRCTSATAMLKALVDASYKGWMPTYALGWLVLKLRHLMDLRPLFDSPNAPFDPIEARRRRRAIEADWDL